MQAKVCAALGNAKRIQIIELLQGNEKQAGTLVQEMGISKANLSQHLQILKNNGLIESRREGVSIFYKITNSKIISACQLMRDVLIDQLDEAVKLRDEYIQSI